MQMPNQRGSKVIKILLIIVIVLLLAIIGTGFYLYLNFKPLIDKFGSDEQTNINSTGENIDKHPYLTDEQEKTLETVGIDPAKLPTEITPQMEECLSQKLGDDRIKEIEQGAEPGMMDLIKAKDCL